MWDSFFSDLLSPNKNFDGQYNKNYDVYFLIFWNEFGYVSGPRVCVCVCVWGGGG